MNKEQEELFEKWHKNHTEIYKAGAYKIWQACLEANKDRMIGIQWPEDEMYKKAYIYFYSGNGNQFTKYQEILRPIEKWHPKEGEWKWVIYLDGEITLDKQEYEFDRTGGIKAFAKLNPENFDAESKMTEADFRSRGDFMEAGE